MTSPGNVQAFRRSLLRWYCKNRRDLPWRKTRDPYSILVSEVMLQQTQVVTVIPYYHEWLRRFPNFASLASAAEEDVLHAWQGLGYYARARNLRATAKMVRNRHDGKFPTDITSIRELPGLGRYTANAVATFAFDQSVPIVEANSARVLTRLFNLRKPIDSSAGREAVWQDAARLIPKNDARDYNSALIDLGALICTARDPRCRVCPVQKFCDAKSPNTLPIKKSRPRTKRLVETHSLSVKRNKILLEQSKSRWCGMWILPRLQTTSRTKSPIHISVFPFTHHRISLQVFRSDSNAATNRSHRWFSIRSLNSIPIPSPHRRAIAASLGIGC